MAYYTGTAATLTALRTAVTDTLVSEGWTWDSGAEIIYNGTMFFRLTVGTISTANHPYIAVQGRTALSGGDIPPSDGAYMREFDGVLFTYPITYHIFTAANDVIVSCEIGAGRWQHFGFGQSQTPGITGTGNYYFAPYGYTTSAPVATTYSVSIPPFSETYVGNYLAPEKNYFIHSGLNPTAPWELSYNAGSSMCGWGDCKNVLDTQPNQFNMESILIPIRAFYLYDSSKYGLIFEHPTMRYCRNDNYSDFEIVTLGADKWVIMPCYKKDITNRTQFTTSSGDYRSGTYAIAVKYEGP